MKKQYPLAKQSPNLRKEAVGTIPPLDRKPVFMLKNNKFKILSAIEHQTVRTKHTKICD